MTKPGQDAHWLNAQRVKAYPRLLLVMFVATTAVWVLLSKNMVDPQGKPFGNDFITFWAASYAALHGHAPDAYNLAKIFKYEQIAVPASKLVFGWYYPPSFYLIALPLALLPYVASFLVWTLSTLALYVVVLRRVVGGSAAMWCLAAFSGLWINLLHGQNAFLTAALAGAGILCLKRRPYLAGVFIGLLAVKPHLALLFPVALLAIGAWRAIASAAVTAFALTAAGTLVLGRDTLTACVGAMGQARYFLENGGLPWQKMPTMFALARLLGMPAGVAYGLHAIVAVGAVAAVWGVWRRSLDRDEDWGLRGAVLMSATFLVSPYVFDYDLAWLAFPIAWLAVIGMRDGWLAGEREVLVLAWLLPMLMAPVTAVVVVQPGPFVLGALLWVVVRRCRSARVSGVVGAGFSPSYTP
jgi:hypothetical protein